MKKILGTQIWVKWTKIGPEISFFCHHFFSLIVEIKLTRKIGGLKLAKAGLN